MPKERSISSGEVFVVIMLRVILFSTVNYNDRLSWQLSKLSREIAFIGKNRRLSSDSIFGPRGD